MAAIDMHTHVFPDDLAPRAIATLEAECPWKAVADGTLSALLESMDASGVDVSVACMIATKPQQVRSIMEWCKQIRSERIEPMPSVHPDTPKAGKWIERIAKAGFAGVKLHPMYQDFAADEERLDAIYDAAAGCGLLVTVHCGRDIAFPPDDDRASPVRLRRVVERFPKLRLLLTHMGGWQMWDEVEQELIGRDVYMETSFSMGDRGADSERIAGMIRRHGVERVLLGSDWPWRSQAEEAEHVRRLGVAASDGGGVSVPLKASEVRQIMVSNAAKLLSY
jgi:hypothetical protein